MNRDELEQLSKDELVEMVLKLQRPSKTSRTSSKPPSTDRKEKRDRSKPGGAKPGHEGRFRALAGNPDLVTDHRPERCSGCGHVFAPNAPAKSLQTINNISGKDVRSKISYFSASFPSKIESRCIIKHNIQHKKNIDKMLVTY